MSDIAIIHFVNYKRGTQSRAAMRGVMLYVMQEKKTTWEGEPLVSGINCQPQSVYDDFLNTKLLYHKDGGVMFYHMVQSFPKGAVVDPRQAHEAARRLAEYFNGCEVLICTHVDREHIHSHCVINSVNFETGKKLHMAKEQLQELKEIARRLNVRGRKTPAQLRAERCGREVRHTHKTRDGQFLWTYTSVKNILVEEAYTGVLNNHRREYNNGKAKHIDKTDWYRHEGFFPVIIRKQEWEQVQRLLKQQARPANGNQAKHRYAGLLTCRECGNTFIPMIRCWNGKSRVEYVCRGYHRNGKSYCSSHRIHEEVLDEQVQACAETVREQCAEEVEKLAQLQKMWALRKPILDAHILSLQEKVLKLEQEIDSIMMEKILNQQTFRRIYDQSQTTS